MNRINNLVYISIALSGFILTWTFNETHWIFPLTIVVLIIWLIIDYLIKQKGFNKRILTGFGKKTAFYKNLILYSIFGGIWIFLSFLPSSNNADILFGLDMRFYMGCFFIVMGFVDIWTFPVISNKKAISFRNTDLNYKRIKLNKIVNCSNEEEELIIKTEKKTINILKKDIPIEIGEFERISKWINEHTRHNKAL